MPRGNGISKEPPIEEKPRIKYFYDSEWLKMVLKGICPECEGPLQKKGRYLRICTENQHLSIYGDPISVAYKKIVQIPQEPILDKGVCPEPGCKCTDFDYNFKTDETSCKKCGVVLSGPPDARVKYPWHVSYSDYIPRKFNKF